MRGHGGVRSIVRSPNCTTRLPSSASRGGGDEHALDEIHHLVVVGEGLVGLEHGELGIVPDVDALVAKHPAEFEDALHAADDEPLEVQLERDAQVHVDVERVVVGDERTGGRAALDRAEDRALDLPVAVLVEVAADGEDRAPADLEDAPGTTRSPSGRRSAAGSATSTSSKALSLSGGGRSALPSSANVSTAIDSSPLSVRITVPPDADPVAAVEVGELGRIAAAPSAARSTNSWIVPVRSRSTREGQAAVAADERQPAGDRDRFRWSVRPRPSVDHVATNVGGVVVGVGIRRRVSPAIRASRSSFSRREVTAGSYRCERRRPIPSAHVAVGCRAVWRRRRRSPTARRRRSSIPRPTPRTATADARGLVALLRNPRWLLGIAGDMLGLILQIVALATGPVVLVQPLLVLALPVSLPIGWWLGGRRPSRPTIVSCALIVAGLALFFAIVGNPGDASVLTGQPGIDRDRRGARRRRRRDRAVHGRAPVDPRARLRRGRGRLVGRRRRAGRRRGRGVGATTASARSRTARATSRWPG